MHTGTRACSHHPRVIFCTARQYCAFVGHAFALYHNAALPCCTRGQQSNLLVCFILGWARVVCAAMGDGRGKGIPPNGMHSVRFTTGARRPTQHQCSGTGGIIGQHIFEFSTLCESVFLEGMHRSVEFNAKIGEKKVPDFGRGADVLEYAAVPLPIYR